MGGTWDGLDTGTRLAGARPDRVGVILAGAVGWGRLPSRRSESPLPKTGAAAGDPVAGGSTGAVSAPAGGGLLGAGIRRSGLGVETSGEGLSTGLPSCRIGRTISSAGSVLQ